VNAGPSDHNAMVDTRLTRSSSKREAEVVQHDREAQRPRVEEMARGNGQASGGGVAVSFTLSSAADLPAVGNPSNEDVNNSSSHLDDGALTTTSRPELRIVPPERDMTCAADDALRLETPTVAQMEAMFGEQAANELKDSATRNANADTKINTSVCAMPDSAAGAGGGTAMIRGLPKNWDERDFTKWLDLLVVSRASCKKKRSWPYGFVTFAFLKDRIDGSKTMEGCKVQGRTISVHEAMSRKTGETTKAWDAAAGAKGAGATGRTREQIIVEAAARGARRDVRDAVCPLWEMPYVRQLSRKREKVEEALRQLTRTVAKNCKRAKKSGNGGNWRWPAWLAEANSRGKIAAPLHGIVRSPVLDGYRNKSEFTIGPDADGKPTVGFNVGLFKEGVTAVASPENCRHISLVGKTLAAAFQTHLRSQAEIEDKFHLPVWDKRRGAGFWRLLTVREGGMAPGTGIWSSWTRDVPAQGIEKDENQQIGTDVHVEDNGLPYPRESSAAEVMVIVQVSPRGFDAGTVRGACSRLAEILLAAAKSSHTSFPITSLLMQVHEGPSNAASADAPIMDLATGDVTTASENVIHEELCGLRFSLSATAFFQVNTCAAEVLYRLAGEWASPNGRSLLLDVCCGTGTIGLTLASSVRKVVGIDIVAAAIEDAKTNAALNGIENCEWVAGRAEETLPNILTRYANRIAPLRIKNVKASKIDAEESGDEEEHLTNPVSEVEAVAKFDRESSTTFDFDDVVAIVDPPRAGLHKNVLWALRKETRLRKLVYVSCNPESMAANCAELCTPQGLDGDSGGTPFKPVKAMAVDLFPHTPHCEAVLLLERVEHAR
jgi:tRNA (uracil-5-)-methyltransferase